MSKSKPVPVAAPAGREFLAVGPNCWGRGTTDQEAIKNARKAFSVSLNGRFRYILYDVDPSTYVDEMGGFCYIPKPGVDPYREVRRVGVPK